VKSLSTLSLRSYTNVELTSVLHSVLVLLFWYQDVVEHRTVLNCCTRSTSSGLKAPDLVSMSNMVWQAQTKIMYQIMEHAS